MFTSNGLHNEYSKNILDEYSTFETNFTNKIATLRFKVIFFGQINTPATLQKIRNEVLKKLTFSGVYVDEVVTCSKNLERNTPDLKTKVDKTSQYSMKIKLSTCFFAQDCIKQPGHIMDRGGIKFYPQQRAKSNLSQNILQKRKSEAPLI